MIPLEKLMLFTNTEVTGLPQWLDVCKDSGRWGNLQVSFASTIIMLFDHLNKSCGLGRAGRVISLGVTLLRVEILILQLASRGHTLLVPQYVTNGHTGRHVSVFPPSEDVQPLGRPGNLQILPRTGRCHAEFQKWRSLYLPSAKPGPSFSSAKTSH